MPFPSGTYILQISDSATRAELEQFYALLQGYLSVDHVADGTHGNIRGRSLTLTADATTGATGNLTADGSGAFDGNVTADADGRAVTLGDIATLTNRTASPGISMARDSTSHFSLIADLVSGSAALVFQDTRNIAVNTQPVALRRTTAVNTTPANYILEPTATTATLDIGENATANRIGSIYAGSIYAAAAFYERLRSVAVGEWTAVAYASGNFTASSGTWTVDSGDQVTFKYMLVGKTIFVHVVIQNTDVSATPNQLRIAIPAGFTAAAEQWGTCDILDAGASREAGKWNVASGGTVINVMRENAGGANWNTTAADNSDVRGLFVFEVQ